MSDTPPAPVRDPGPPLGSTADPVAYVPVSWMAVAAFATTAVFVLVLLVLGYTAWRGKSPLIAPQLLALPVVAVILAFAARRIVATSEGTRTGELFGIDLVNGAWWGAVVVGLVYLTYMAAVEFSIRREAEAEIGRWVGQVMKDDIPRAFHRTRDPAERASIAPDNAGVMEKRYANDWLAFRQTDLVRITSRNPGACEYVAGGLRDWAIKTGGVECMATGTLRCPEGLFPVQFALKAADAVGTDVGGGRQWQVVPSPNGFLRDEPQLTAYGWHVIELQRQGREAAAVFLNACRDRSARPYAAVEFAGLFGDPDVRLLSLDAGAARLAAVGAPAGLGWNLPDSVYTATAAKLFRLPGKKAPSTDQHRTFQTIWKTDGLVPPGTRLRQSGDLFDLMSLTDDAVEIRIPVELPVASSKLDLAARGRAIFVCTDPAMLAEVKRLRAEANPDVPGKPPEPNAPRTIYRWKLDRVESDLRPVSARDADGGPPPAGGPGGPPGM